MGKTKMGRASIFRGKEDGVRYQGVITKAASRRFERARRDLELLVTAVRGAKPSVVSDADVIEYLARGEPETRSYLESGR
jgi:hypothetical protein